jgi:hypothetical protein
MINFYIGKSHLLEGEELLENNDDMTEYSSIDTILTEENIIPHVEIKKMTKRD